MNHIPFQRYYGRVSAFGAYGRPTLEGIHLSRGALILFALIGLVAVLYVVGALDGHGLGLVALGAGPVTSASFMAPEEIQARRDMANYLAKMQGIVAAAGDNPLTPNQDRDFKAAEVELRKLQSQFRLTWLPEHGTRSEQLAAAEAAMSQPLYGPAAPPTPDGIRRYVPGEVRTLRPTESLESVVGHSNAPDGAVGDVIRSLVTGNTAYLPEHLRAQSGGIGSAGGFTVPTDLSARLIDRARAASVVNQAGSLLVPMDTAELSLARLESGATVGWKAENAAAPQGNLTFGRVTLRAKTLIALLVSSVELAEDSPNYGAAVETELAQSLAIELDRACMFGAGAASEPLGIANQAGIGTTAVGAALTRYTNVGTAVRLIKAANHDPDFLFLAPRTWGFFDALEDTTNQPLRPPASFEQLVKFPTTSVPITQGAGSDTTLIIGRGEEILVGVRTQVVIEASRQASDGTNRAFPQLQVHIRAYLRADVALAHPAAFHTLTGVSS